MEHRVTYWSDAVSTEICSCRYQQTDLIWGLPPRKYQIIDLSCKHTLQLFTMDLSCLSLVQMKSKHKLNVFHSKCTADSSDQHTTIFFIHGSMGSLTHFSDIIISFQGRVNIVAYDTIGCGGSDKPHDYEEYSTQSLTNNAIEIFDQFCTAKNILVGHSYGTAQIARLCSNSDKLQSGSANASISGIVLLGTIDCLPNGGSSAFSVFALPLFVLKPMQSWMSKAYTNMAFSDYCDPMLRERALLLAGISDFRLNQEFKHPNFWHNPHYFFLTFVIIDRSTRHYSYT